MNGTRHYDAAIIGAGQGRKPLALAAACTGRDHRMGARRRLRREEIDAAVGWIIDRYLAEGSKLRRLQIEKQIIHPRDLLPDKRRALIEEVFTILGETGKG